MLDCKLPSCQTIYTAPEVDTFLETFEWNPEASQHFTELCQTLTGLGIPFKVNRRLVRGLDYYTRTVFELVTTKLGAQGTVCGGGRYNQLIESLGGVPTPAVGWGIGFERLFMLVKDSLPSSQLTVYIVNDQPVASFLLAQHLREQGHRVEVDLSGRKFTKQLEQASKRGAAYAIILGEQEVAAQQAQLKCLATAEQTPLSLIEPQLP
jgi:histidyl-tRNA synthetase